MPWSTTVQELAGSIFGDKFDHNELVIPLCAIYTAVDTN